MRRFLSISVLTVISLLLAAGCEEPVQSTPEKPIVADSTPDNEGTPEQPVTEQPVTEQVAPVQVSTDSPAPDRPAEQVDLAQVQTPVETPVADVNEELAMPEIRFEKVVHDYGDIGGSTKNKAEFPFKNVGTGVLKIPTVQTSCGCTVPELKKKTYEPGESGVIVVEFHSSHVPGKPRKTLYAITNDPENPKVALTVKANVVQRVACEPERLKFFIGEEHEEIQEITLTSTDGKPFSIKSFKATGDVITADIDPGVEATKFVLKAHINGEKLKSHLRGNINVTLTHPECPYVTMYFDVIPKYTVNPPMIILFEAAPSKAISRKVWILSNYDKSFEVDSIVSADGSVKEVSKKEIHDGYELMVEIVPPDPKGKIDYSGRFSVKLTDGTELPIEYRVFYAESESENDVPSGPIDP